MEYPKYVKSNDSDLMLAIRQGMRPMLTWYDPARRYLPYFYNYVEEERLGNSHHESYSAVHTMGRWWDALVNASFITGEAVPEEIYEHLIFYGERGEYTWDNYYAVLDKMDAIIKPDSRFVEGLKEFTYLTVKRLRGLSGPLNGAAAWSIGTIVYGISKVFGDSETGDYLEDLSAKIIMNKGADLQDHWLAEWLGIRKGVVQQGEKEENAWRSIGKLAEYTLIRGAVGGAGGGRFGGTVANLWSAVDTWVVAFEQAYEEGMDVEDAREYAYKRAKIEFRTAYVIDGLRMGDFATSGFGKFVTEYLSQFGWGKAIIYFFNIVNGSAAAAIAEEAARKTEEDYNLRPERDPEERHRQFIEDFSWNLGLFGLVEIAGWVIKQVQGTGPEQPGGVPGEPDVPALPPGNGGGQSPNVPMPVPPGLLPPGKNGINPGRLLPIPPSLFPPRGEGVSPGGVNPIPPMPPEGKNTPADPPVPGTGPFAPSPSVPHPTPGQTNPFDYPEAFQPDSDDISPEQERQIIDGLGGRGSAEDFSFVPGRDPRLPLPGGKEYGIVRPAPGALDHGISLEKEEPRAGYEEQEEKMIAFFKERLRKDGVDIDSFVENPERDIIDSPQENEEILEDGVNRYQPRYTEHMVKGRLATRREFSDGIIGGHNYDEFKLTLSSNGFDPADCIQSIVPSKDFPGLYNVYYRIPKRMRGQIVPGEYRVIPIPKTVYDPKLYSDKQMAEWGREAMQNAKKYGRFYYGVATNGMKFVGYYDANEGRIRNFHPVLNFDFVRGE